MQLLERETGILSFCGISLSGSSSHGKVIGCYFSPLLGLNADLPQALLVEEAPAEGGQHKKEGSWEMSKAPPPSPLYLGKWLSGRALAERCGHASREDRGANG